MLLVAHVDGQDHCCSLTATFQPLHGIEDALWAYCCAASLRGCSVHIAFSPRQNLTSSSLQ